MSILDTMTALEAVKDVLADDGVHNLTKDIIRRGLNLDPVDAYFDARLAADVLKKVMDHRLGRG
ncbi:hypothetical protein LCGC14_2976320 [marine sediment metagenome]|uniref:Uncharacterized protein n=1 Tax=marine sediment metagenome TaxID=412755 RepID=A0A0F8ZZ57_9ZZZZ